MTNKEYIEINKIGFSDAMNMWDEKKYPCINDWLKADRIECPFKAGDFFKNMYYDDAICVVIDIKDFVYYKMIKRDGTFAQWNYTGSTECKYYAKDNTVFAYPIDICAKAFKKIY